MDIKELVKIGLLFLLLPIAGYAAIKQNWIAALIAFAAFLFFAWRFFSKPGTDETKNKTKEECISIAMGALESNFKHTVESNGSFSLYDDQIVGDWWKFVFMRVREGLRVYYFASVHLKTGEIGERTGVKTAKVNEVEWFLHKDRQTAAPAEFVPSQELINALKKELSPDDAGIEGKDTGEVE